MSADIRSALDLNAYFARIGYTGGRTPTAEVLAELHLKHATHVPFENLDIQLDRPIRLDLESLQAKLVRDRRGGYCFEQNTLFAAVLEELGFSVTRLAARVRLVPGRITPRSHMTLKVDMSESAWLADVGFGGQGLLHPLPLKTNHIVGQGVWTHRLVREGELWVLQASRAGDWQDQYAFTLEPQYPVDYEVASYYTATHPSSHFVHTLTAQLPTPTKCYILRNREFTVQQSDEVNTTVVSGDEELLRLLSENFGLRFPAGTRFRCLLDEQ